LVVDELGDAGADVERGYDNCASGYKRVGHMSSRVIAVLCEVLL
jgi:hypothetical protein